ncbi:hypothetical protein [Cribrihabitans pelagius]|uniref:hypothetical protein n=1 Tax=Cribrihabitans pelagius TaxID=1765746 RepID=UPI003B5B30D3
MTALMTPGFALFLYPESITLRARTNESGWQDVGSTRFAVPDLPGALAALREKAQADGPDALQCALVLPAEMIRHLTIETGEVDTVERRAQAEKALEGATPYAVAELVFDISAEGALTHIAAAAKETLAEAEGFARAHGFTPVSFTAEAEGTAFKQPPVFGQCKAVEAAGQRPAADVQEEAQALEAPAARSSDAAEPAEPTEPAAAQEAEAQPLPPAPPAPGAEVTDAAAPANAAGPEDPAPAPDAVLTPAAQSDSQAAADQASPAPAAVPEPNADPGFTSRRSKPKETQAPAQPAAPRKAAAAPAIPPAPELSAPGTAQAPSAPAPAAIPPAPGLSAPVKAARTTPRPAPAQPAAPAAATPVPPPSAVSAAKLLQAPSAKPAMENTASEARAPAQPLARFLPAALRGLPRSRSLTLSALVLLAVTGVSVMALVSGSGPEESASRSTTPDAGPAMAADAGSSRLSGASGAEGGEEPPIAPQVGVLADLPDPGLRETGESADGADPDAPQNGELAFEADSVETSAPEEAETAAEARDPEQLAFTRAAQYAATGIWQSPPEIAAPAAPAGPEAGSDGIFVASIDNGELSQDAVALPPAESFAADTAPDSRASPAAPGSTFELDARGLVKATPEGALNPDGIRVYLGRPKVVPPRTPDRPDPASEAAAETAARDLVLSQKRPRARPADLAETAERAQLGGFSRAELATLRPRPRPASLKPANEDRLPATAQAVRSSPVPRARPANFANLVDRARRNAANAASTVQAAAVPAAAAAPAPRIPSSASVARRATTGNAINLRKLNLIGVYGTPSDRRALVRLPSGRYKKVKVGDRIDGGRVIAIGESQLQYQKSGRNRTLEMPNS